MGLKCGVVGLPNVGKSTLFNALTNATVESSNYPFCTIDANRGIVHVSDRRLNCLGEMSASAKQIPATVEFVDIAGLVRGASKGEGLGSQFLTHIRNVDAVIQVVRLFEDGEVIHVHGTVDPVEDLEVINMELLLKDVETLENAHQKQSKLAKTGVDKKALPLVRLIERILPEMQKGTLLRLIEQTTLETELLKPYQLLTMKPMLIVANIGESDLQHYTTNAHYQALSAQAQALQVRVLPMSVRLEQELSELEPEERLAYLEDMGAQETGIQQLSRATYDLLGLLTYFTTGPQETRAWTITQGTMAPQAGGVIHGDIERGFIRAEVVDVDTLLGVGSWLAAKESGVLRQEGKEYEMQDGDVVHFLFNV